MTPLDRFDCEATFRRLDDYLDRTLSAEERKRVEEHLAECEICAREYRFEQSIIDDVRRKLDRIMAPRHLVERITSALERAP